MLRGRSYMSSVPREREVTESINLGRAKESLIPLPRAITIGQRNKLKERLPPSSSVKEQSKKRKYGKGRPGKGNPTKGNNH